MSRASARTLKKTPEPVAPIEPPKKRIPRWPFVAVVAVLVVAGLVTWAVLSSIAWNAQHYADDMHAMAKQVGVVNDQQFPLVISDKISNDQVTSGQFILFVGSITNQEQHNIAIGYKAPNGDSYKLYVPVASVIFHQEEGITPSGSFRFDDWYPEYTFQSNVDSLLGNDPDPSKDRVTINLTPEQFKELIKS